MVKTQEKTGRCQELSQPLEERDHREMEKEWEQKERPLLSSSTMDTTARQSQPVPPAWAAFCLVIQHILPV